MSVFDHFVGLYSVSKTIPFELRPVINSNFQTEEERVQALKEFWEKFKSAQSYKDDDQRAKSYPIVKALMDQFHKKIIKESLSNFTYDGWDRLAEAYKDNKNSENFKSLQKSARERIVSAFKKHKLFAYVEKMPELVKDHLQEEIKHDEFLEDFRTSNKTIFADNNLSSEGCDIDSYSDEEYRRELSLHISIFLKFPGSYFAKYKKNRENIYSSKPQNTAVGNRLVNENFVTFVENVRVYNRLVEHCPNELKEIEQGLEFKLNGKTLAEVFTYEFYNQCLTQQGIDFYNYLVGGDTSVQTGVFGLNDVGNKYLQQHPDCNLRLKDLKMSKLYKQILSDRQLPKFLRKKFATADEMKDAVSLFIGSMQDGGINQVLNILGELKDSTVNHQQIYVTGKWISTLSKSIFGSWDSLSYQLRDDRINADPQRERRSINKEIEEWIEKKIFTLEEICAAANNLEDGKASSVYLLLTSLIAQKKKYNKNENDEVTVCWEDYNLWEECQKSIKILKESKEEDYNDNLKVVLDQLLHLFHVVSILRLGNKEESVNKDSYYILYNQLFNHEDNTENTMLCDIVPLYDAVRDFINTNKLSNEGKTKLNFDSATLTNQWKKAFIVKKGNKYYLGIYNGSSVNFNKFRGNTCVGIIHKQQTKLVANFTHWFVCSVKEKRDGEGNITRPASYPPTASLPEIQKLFEPIKNKYWIYDALSKSKKKQYLEEHGLFREKLFHYYIECIKKHNAFKPFLSSIERVLKAPEDYHTTAEIAADVEPLCYSLDYINLDFEAISKSNDVLLFQIYNKDYSDFSSPTSQKNLHTLLWEEVFSKRNALNVVFKLASQGAEILFRNQKQNDDVVHKKGSWLVNKRFKDGSPIPEKIYLQLSCQENINNEGEYILSKLSPETRECLKSKSVSKPKKARYDIKKDKRYSENKCMLHVPIEINFGKPKVDPERIKAENTKFNNYALSVLREHRDELNIIGVDRGERNLIYVTLINQRGEIEYSRSFNIVDNVGADGVNRPFDYHEKLDQIEGDRVEARKNWKKQKKIKDTKKGYIGFVVHEISKLMVQNNAIVVLEDLNFGFKRGRFGIEKQVYQEFEKELISKLNYLALKSGSPSESYANIHNGLQLTAPFSSFKDLGKQSGWLFYVPASYTSKIDPTTGFVNLFNMKKAEKNPKEFFMSFIRIEHKDGTFVFEFDYSKENTYTVAEDYQNVWTITSRGARLVYNPLTKKTELIDLSQKLMNVFEAFNIDLKNLSIDTLNKIEDEKFFKKLLSTFKYILQMRNSNQKDDYIVSPVDIEAPFDTRKEAEKGKTVEGTWISKLPADADANGAYHIALKGLYLVLNNFPMEYNKDTKCEYLKYITTAEWLRFVQMHTFRN